jgi:hypothetical protein
MSDESIWIDRAQSAEAKLATLKQSLALSLDRVKTFKSNFGLKERDNGEIVIDFDKFIERLGPENALALKDIIEKRYG